MRDANDAIFEYLVDGKSNHTTGEEMAELSHKSLSMTAAVTATMQKYKADKQIRDLALNEPSVFFTESKLNAYDQARVGMTQAAEARYDKTWKAFIKEGYFNPNVHKHFDNLESFHNTPHQEIKIFTAGATTREKKAIAQAEELNYLKSLKEGLTGTEPKNLTALQYMSENRLAKNHSLYPSLAADKAFATTAQKFAQSGEAEILPGLRSLIMRDPLKSLQPTIKAALGGIGVNALLDHFYFDDRHTGLPSTIMDAVGPCILATQKSPRFKFAFMVGSHCLGKLGDKRYSDLDKERDDREIERAALETVERLRMSQTGNGR